METCAILCIRVPDRIHLAGEVQKVLTEFGCNIHVRLGLHEAGGDSCSPAGIIVLQVVGGEKVSKELSKRLGAIKGVETRTVSFGA